jgi:GWxTD domain-containing protein
MIKTIDHPLAVKIGIILICMVFVFGIQPLEANKKVYKQLNDKYKRWLDEVDYIITKNERKIFFKLKTDRERDIFLNAFWSHRDPTPGTKVNEFKDEHYRRLRYVENLYGRNKAIPGWKTDRGKVYIILGEPIAIQRFNSYTKIYPTEVWHYQQEPRAGLPPAFNLIFFDKHGTGEYVLYSPIADGPQRLLIGYQGKPGEYQEAFEKLYEFNSFLARTAISLVPGEEVTTGRPSMSSDFLLRNIEIAPKKLVEDLYAKKFLQYKGTVEVEYSANYMRNKSLSHIFKDEFGNNIFHYMVEFQKLSVDQFDELYYATIEVYGNLTDLSGTNVYQFKKTYEIKMDAVDFRQVQSSNFAIADKFPVIPGDYRLSIIMKNTNSKEFTAYETDISVPTKPTGVSLSNLLLAYQIKPAAALHRNVPFQSRHGRFMIDSENRFSRKEKLNVFFQLDGVSAELRNSGKIKLQLQGERNFVKEIYKNLSEFPENDNGCLIEYPLTDLPTDYYTATVSVMDGAGKVLTGQNKRFMIAPLAVVRRPQIFSKTSSIDTEAVNNFILASQYMNAKKPAKALPLMEKAYHKNPRVIQFALGLANAYLELENYAKIETILTPLANPEKPDFQTYSLLGTACQRIGKYQAAVEYFRKLIRYHGFDTNVLNSLASCHYQLGELEEARRAWEQSLKVEPNQEKVKNALRGLKNENQNKQDKPEKKQKK